jgi:predicted GTPase
LKKGNTTAVKQEMKEIAEEMKKLAAMPESAEKRALREQLQQRLNALSEALKQQMNSPALNAALQRAYGATRPRET